MEKLKIQKVWYNEQIQVTQNTETICDCIGNMIAVDFIGGISGGVYLSSNDAGVKPSVDLWSSALEKGPAFVFPQTFPHTLANFPAGFLARKIQFHGPNYTFVGTAEAVFASIQQAVWDLEDGLVDYALITAIDFGEPTNFAGFVVSTDGPNSKNYLSKSTGEGYLSDFPEDPPATFLSFLLQQFESTGTVDFGLSSDGCFRLSQ